MATDANPKDPDFFNLLTDLFPDPISEDDPQTTGSATPWLDGWRRSIHGTWEFRFMMDGERYEEDTFLTDKREAKKFLLQYKSNILKRKQLGIQPTPKFRDFKHEYIASLVADGCSEGHLKAVKHMINNYMSDLDDLFLNQIDDRVVDRLILAFERAPRLGSSGKPQMTMDPKTGKKIVKLHNQGGKRHLCRTLDALMNRAIHRKYILDLPYKLREISVDEIQWTVLTREQVGLFLALTSSISTRDYPWEQIQVAIAIHMMLLLGLRESEATKAQWHQAIWGTNLFIPTDTKNFKVQPLPMGKLMRKVLEEYWEKCGKPRTGLMFPMLPRPYEIGTDIPKDRQFPKGWTYRTVNKIGDEMGLVGLTPHRLRNTFATLHYEMGTDLLTLRRLLRHHSLATTEKYIMRTSTKAMGDQQKYEDWIGLDPNTDFRAEFLGGLTLPNPVPQASDDFIG